jgi:hypothetical protein
MTMVVIHQATEAVMADWQTVGALNAQTMPVFSL